MTLPDAAAGPHRDTQPVARLRLLHRMRAKSEPSTGGPVTVSSGRCRATDPAWRLPGPPVPVSHPGHGGSQVSCCRTRPWRSGPLPANLFSSVTVTAVRNSHPEYPNTNMPRLWRKALLPAASPTTRAPKSRRPAYVEGLVLRLFR